MMSLTEALRRINKPNDELARIQKFINSNYPSMVKALRMIDSENLQPKRGKGFTLVKRENKKHVFLFYVRYYHNGKMIPSKWNTRTNNPEEAERFAVENRERLIGQYQKSRDTRMYEFLTDFYADAKGMAQKRIRLAAKSVRIYHATVVNKFIPFLKKDRITDFDQVTPVTLDNFQDHLLSLGVRPQTANNYMKPIKQIFAYLARKGMMKENPADRIRGVPVEQSDLIPRGCYELEKIRGIFGKRWKNETSYLLVLMIYTTGMRNCEIQRIQMEDIQTIEDCRFINIRESKTDNGIRLVPLHDFVYKKIKARADKTEATEKVIKAEKAARPVEGLRFFCYNARNEKQGENGGGNAKNMRTTAAV